MTDSNSGPFDEDFDQKKSQRTKNTRGIDFIEARAVFDDPDGIEGPGTVKNGEELRRPVASSGEGGLEALDGEIHMPWKFDPNLHGSPSAR